MKRTSSRANLRDLEHEATSVHSASDIPAKSVQPRIRTTRSAMLDFVVIAPSGAYESADETPVDMELPVLAWPNCVRSAWQWNHRKHGAFNGTQAVGNLHDHL